MSDWTRCRLLAAGAVAMTTAGCAALEDAAPDGTDTATTDGAQTDSPGASTNTLDAGSSTFAEVYRRTIDSVVTVRVYDGFANGAGSGFVLGDGTIVTNHHVVEGAEEIDVAFTEGEWTTAEVLGSDPYADLAALEPGERPDYADPLTLVRADPPIGTEVMALGNPFQLEASATSGIVSGIDRSLSGPNDFPIPDAIQTDAAVNPGNSGGPLVNLDGKVVGVITAGGGENIAFAISAPLTRRIVPELVETGSYEHAYVGVRLLTVGPDVAEANDLQLEEPHGVLVAEVVEGGPADGVLRGSPRSEEVQGREIPTGGDVILSLDGRTIRTLEELSSYIALNKAPGDDMAVEVLRDGERRTVDLTLGERPDA